MSTNHPRHDPDAIRAFREDVRGGTCQSGDSDDDPEDGVVEAIPDRDREDRSGVSRDVGSTR